MELAEATLGCRGGCHDRSRGIRADAGKHAGQRASCGLSVVVDTHGRADRGSTGVVPENASAHIRDHGGGEPVARLDRYSARTIPGSGVGFGRAYVVCRGANRGGVNELLEADDLSAPYEEVVCDAGVQCLPVCLWTAVISER